MGVHGPSGPPGSYVPENEAAIFELGGKYPFSFAVSLHRSHIHEAFINNSLLRDPLVTFHGYIYESASQETMTGCG